MRHFKLVMMEQMQLLKTQKLQTVHIEIMNHEQLKKEINISMKLRVFYKTVQILSNQFQYTINY